MSIQMTGLDIAIRRMQSIERQFEMLANVSVVGVDSDFQSILQRTMSQQNSASPTPDMNSRFIPHNCEIPAFNQPASVSFNPQANVFNQQIPAFNQTIEVKSNVDSVDNLINKYSARHNLDPDFVKALIKQESGFQNKARSHCGAMGLMQLMPQTALSLGVQNAYDPEQNIAGGTKYLRELLDQYQGNRELALAAYNAGPGAVNKHGGIPPYNETQNYVKNVLKYYQDYKLGGDL